MGLRHVSILIESVDTHEGTIDEHGTLTIGKSVEVQSQDVIAVKAGGEDVEFDEQVWRDDA